MDRLYITNATKYNHYHKRKPPWVKLHRDILDSTTYAKLPDKQWRLGLELVLLCSESEDGQIDYNLSALSWRLRRRIAQFDIEALISSGFLSMEHDASDMLAGCLHDSIPETETETEERQRQNKADLPVGFSGFWDSYRAALKLCDRRIGYKQEALAKWRKMGCEEYADQIINAIDAQVEHYKQSSGNGKRPPAFPDPHRWLAHRRFNDELPA